MSSHHKVKPHNTLYNNKPLNTKINRQTQHNYKFTINSNTL